MPCFSFSFSVTVFSIIGEYSRGFGGVPWPFVFLTCCHPFSAFRAHSGLGGKVWPLRAVSIPLAHSVLDLARLHLLPHPVCSQNAAYGWGGKERQQTSSYVLTGMLPYPIGLSCQTEWKMKLLRISEFPSWRSG